MINLSLEIPCDLLFHNPLSLVTNTNLTMSTSIGQNGIERIIDLQMVIVQSVWQKR